MSNITHGAYGTSIYRIWRGIRDRCSNPNLPDYQYYGIRGIKVCYEWQNSFEAFRNWAIVNGYKQGLTIDRKNNDGNYEPSNCKWTDMKSQSNNKRSTIYIEIDGITKPKAEWCEIYKINPVTVEARILRGWSKDDAVMIPTNKNMRRNRNVTDTLETFA